ncbi:MAG: isochorismatase family protein [Proteobacteria bacterium]|nr:isochorismatase family protein [Pseudomonadota bacterium]
MKTHLLIIDPQNSFCDPQGELYVPRADLDMTRLSRFIDDKGDFIFRVTVTLDSHNRMHIAHPVWWLDEKGHHPRPFTVIQADDLTNGRYRTVDPQDQAWSLTYLEKTAPHVIWPMHCLAGTWGHKVYAPLSRSLDAWTEKHTDLEFIFKGSSRYTEHFSAIKPSVPVPDDPMTQPNRMLVKTLAKADRILVAGEASSHCVSETVRDLIREAPGLAHKIILLRDCMSSVGGFESLAENFFKDMADQNVQITESARVTLT